MKNIFLLLFILCFYGCQNLEKKVFQVKEIPSTQQALSEQPSWKPLPAPPIVDGTLVLSLQRCLELTLNDNVEIQLGHLAIHQRAEDYFIADEKFVPVGLVKASQAKDTTPSVSSLGGADILREDTQDVSARISKNWLTGARTDLTWAQTRKSSNSTFLTINPSYEDTVELNIEQPLLQGFGVDVNYIELKKAIENKKIAESDLLITLESELLSVYRLYWELVLASHEFNIQKISLDLAQDQLNITQDRLDAGVASPLELTEAQASLARQEEDLLDAKLNFSKASDRLIVKMRPVTREEGFPLQIIPSTEPPEIPPPNDEISLSSLIQKGLQNRVELKRLATLIRLAHLDIDLAQDRLKSDLNLTGSYALNGLGSSRNQSIKDLEHPSWSVGLQLSFLFDNQSRRAKWRQALSSKREVQWQKKRATTEIIQEVKSAYYDLQIAYEKVKATKKTLLLTEEQYLGAKDQLEAGQTTHFVVERFRRDLLDSQKNHIKSQIEIFLAKALLEATTGSFADQIMQQTSKQ